MGTARNQSAACSRRVVAFPTYATASGWPMLTLCPCCSQAALRAGGEAGVILELRLCCAMSGADRAYQVDGSGETSWHPRQVCHRPARSLH
eukprot:362586-Rhodomonas_salina.2